MGSKGIGEIGIVGTAAAIGNAVFHATGVRLRELPLTPDRVLSGIRERGGSSAG
jgi:xanthine dehydrogenase YagR molybdenum-binding subunit